MQTLYKYSTKGAPLQWSIEVVGDRYRTIEGQVGGKLTTSQWTICFPKNIGKANSTTAEEQAQKKAESIFRKKKESGFSESLETSGAKYFEPMLAHKWDEHPIKDGEEIALQPKLDGHRCIAYLKDGKVYLQSRKGKHITSCVHIEKELENFFQQHPSVILDGELYNHSIPFETISGAVRKIEPSKESLLIQYHVYDAVLPDRNADFFTRHSFLKENLKASLVVEILKTQITNSHSMAEICEERWVEEGYEGIMVRNTKFPYENKRSKSLLKWKRFEDEEFRIVEINEGQGNRTGLATEAVLSLPDGKTFSAGIIGNDDYSRNLYNNREKVKNLRATVKFQGKTNTGIPRFGKMKIVRYEGF